MASTSLFKTEEKSKRLKPSALFEDIYADEKKADALKKKEDDEGIYFKHFSQNWYMSWTRLWKVFMMKQKV